MAHNFSQRITYYLSVSKHDKDLLYSLRGWENIKIVEDESILWLKDFTSEQLFSTKVKSIPNVKLYYEKDNTLYKVNSLLPYTTVPTGLWTAIDRYLNVTLPITKVNDIAIEIDCNLDLKSSTNIKQESAILVKLNDLKKFVDSMSSIRLSTLKWTIISEFAFFIGPPVLSIPGLAYWNDGGLYFPCGKELKLTILIPVLKHKLLHSSYDYFIWIDNEICGLSILDMQNCSISSLKDSLT